MVLSIENRPKLTQKEAGSSPEKAQFFVGELAVSLRECRFPETGNIPSQGSSLVG